MQLSNETLWINNLNSVKKYMDDNSKIPSKIDKNQEINFLGMWLLIQIENYNKKEYIMRTKNIYNIWTEFINDDKYKNYFI